jgi:hypothetical protein
MPATGRLFVCARCRAQVIVCRRCDRGQIYCDSDCAQVSRQTSLREAGDRYQRSRHGRFAHAERMRRYRSRQNKVTQQGSIAPAADALLAPTSTTSAAIAPVPTAATPVPEHCHFCQCVCPGFVRLGPLRRRVFRDVRTATHCTGNDP